MIAWSDGHDDRAISGASEWDHEWKGRAMDDNFDAVEDLKEHLSNKVVEKFRTGDVIRWVGGGMYTYCAIKCGNGLWSISGTGMFYGGEQKTYEQILKILGRSDATEIAAATAWDLIP